MEERARPYYRRWHRRWHRRWRSHWRPLWRRQLCPRRRPRWTRPSRLAQRALPQRHRAPPPGHCRACALARRRSRSPRLRCSPRSRPARRDCDAKGRTPTDLCACARRGSLVMDRRCHGSPQRRVGDSFSLPSSTFAMGGTHRREKSEKRERRESPSRRSSGRLTRRSTRPASATSRTSDSARSRKLRLLVCGAGSKLGRAGPRQEAKAARRKAARGSRGERVLPCAAVLAVRWREVGD
jgi:hypothetical protein